VTEPRLEPFDGVLRRLNLAGIAERPFPNDGWSGATLTLLVRGDERFVVKRLPRDGGWIGSATRDRPVPREAWFAAAGPPLPSRVVAPYLGAGASPDGSVAVVMPDLTATLLPWDAPVTPDELDRVLDGLAALHMHPWSPADVHPGASWSCPIRERVTLISRRSLERPGPARDAVGDRILPGWDAWDRVAPANARELIAALDADPAPLVRSLAALPSTLLHGDLKLANVGLRTADGIELVDWQMVMAGPIAIELGWLLVSNVAAVPLAPADVLERYRRSRADAGGPDWERQAELAWIVGLLLRGWRKGLDAEAGITLASGVRAVDDLAEWCERAEDAAGRAL
jgi:hypothetical protein